jgi:hypothetical protein
MRFLLNLSHSPKPMIKRFLKWLFDYKVLTPTEIRRVLAPESLKMELKVIRYSSQKDSTLGLLMKKADFGGWEFMCYTLEDEYRTVKKYGETRIPAGRYRITLRTVGRIHQKYKEEFGEIWHRGTLWVREVPNFTYILIHRGLTDDHTAGCLLVADGSFQNITEKGTLASSNTAYKRIYEQIRDVLVAGDEVWITYEDFDNPMVLG